MSGCPPYPPSPSPGHIQESDYLTFLRILTCNFMASPPGTPPPEGGPSPTDAPASTSAVLAEASAKLSSVSHQPEGEQEPPQATPHAAEVRSG